jgi:hypothetical protein
MILIEFRKSNNQLVFFRLVNDSKTELLRVKSWFKYRITGCLAQKRQLEAREAEKRGGD